MDSEAQKGALDVERKRLLPSSKEVADAAHSSELTLKLVSDYKLTAIELSELLNRLPIKAVPW